MGIGVMVKETGVLHKDLSVCQSLGQVYHFRYKSNTLL